MSEEAEAKTAESTADPVALVGHDGAFSENWKDSLPEEIRGEKVLDNLGDFKGLMTQFVHAQKMIGKDKIVVPDDKSTDNDWNMFWDKTGRPPTHKEYEFTKDDTLPEGTYDDALLEKFLEGAHKVGINKKQMAFLNEFENARLKSGLEQMQELQEKDKAECDAAVKAKWGAAYNEMMHLANLYVNETTEEGADRDAILTRIGNDPVIADWMARSAKKYIAEDRAITSTMTTKTPAEALTEAEKLRATEGYINGQLANTNPARYNEITRKIQELYKIAYSS